MICVDSSVIIGLLRGKHTPETAVLHRLEEERVVYVIPLICAQEVLQGARSRKDWQLLEKYFRTQILVGPRQNDTYFNAAAIFYDLRRKGVTVRSTVDCLIAEICLENDFLLLHSDRDFHKIQSVRPLRIAG